MKLQKWKWQKLFFAAAALLAGVAAAEAMDARLDFVNQSGSDVTLEGGCAPPRGLALANGQTRSVTCSFPRSLIVFTAPGRSRLCLISIRRDGQAVQTGSDSCIVTSQRGGSPFRVLLRGPFQIRLYNSRSQPVDIFAFTPSNKCRPQRWTLPAKNDLVVFCTPDDAASAAGITVQARENGVLVCSAIWHRKKVETVKGPCSATPGGGSIADDYVLDVK